MKPGAAASSRRTAGWNSCTGTCHADRVVREWASELRHLQFDRANVTSVAFRARNAALVQHGWRRFPVQWTGEQAQSDKRGKLKPLTKQGTAAPADIWRVASHPKPSHPKQWLRQVQDTESLYYRAIGSAEALMAKAEAMGQIWIKGVVGVVARKILREQPT